MAGMCIRDSKVNVYVDGHVPICPSLGEMCIDGRARGLYRISAANHIL